MLRDLLEATRAETGKMRVEPRCIALGELVQQTVAMMRPTAQAKKIGLEVGLDQHLPLVHADPDRVLEVLINLVDNAIKFTPPEGAVMLQGHAWSRRTPARSTFPSAIPAAALILRLKL